eukprot:1193872-Prorocentrum_minimum.AAC.1
MRVTICITQTAFVCQCWLVSHLRRRPARPASQPRPHCGLPHPCGPPSDRIPSCGARRARSASRGRSATIGHTREGKYRSSVDAREPQNPTKSEEYQKHLQAPTIRRSKLRVQRTGSLDRGLIQVPCEAPVCNLGHPKDVRVSLLGSDDRQGPGFRRGPGGDVSVKSRRP